MRVLYAPNMRSVYLAGNEFGATHYVVAESFEDAWEEFLHAVADENICDHGGEISDDDRWAELAGERPSTCDCEVTDDGRFVWSVYLWVEPMALSVEMFLLAAEAFERAA